MRGSWWPSIWQHALRKLAKKVTSTISWTKHYVISWFAGYRMKIFKGSCQLRLMLSSNKCAFEVAQGMEVAHYQTSELQASNAPHDIFFQLEYPSILVFGVARQTTCQKMLFSITELLQVWKGGACSQVCCRKRQQGVTRETEKEEKKTNQLCAARR